MGVMEAVCVTGKTRVIAGNKLIGYQSPPCSAELVALNFKNVRKEGRITDLGSQHFISYHTIALET
jgi:hypothetical protein